MGLLALLHKGCSVARTISSDFVSDHIYEHRQETCRECPDYVLVRGIWYCDACECPHVPRYAQRWKNTKAGWRCPLGKHRQ